MRDNHKPDDARKISRAEFDNLARAKKFAPGFPLMSLFGDGYGDPYIPPSKRDVWGRLQTGEAVWADDK